jgi:hypothetical protein
MRADVTLLVLFCLGASLQADVLVRWEGDEIPSAASLGIARIVVPATHRKAIENAVTQGYDVYLEHASERRLVQLRPHPGTPKGRVLSVDGRGKWPHIRTNWVTRNNAVLQVTARSAQPWIDSNAALLRIINAATSVSMPLLTYAWKPITLSDIDEGPALENYLVAIAEAGSFGGNLLLPVHERFERDLLLGKPRARAGWNEIRRYIEFYSWNLPARYRPIANIGVVTADSIRWFEVMNLLARHNLPFELIAPTALAARDLAAFKLLIVPDEPSASQREALAAFERKGGAVVTPKGIGDPNKFALEMRQKLGRDHRVIDIWNGITVIAAPYEEPNGESVLVTAVNYSHQPLPVQMRVRGTFSLVHYESPEEPPALLPYEHRDGCTEFVIPALRIGGRVFLSERQAR